jgi:hypothetical protein
LGLVREVFCPFDARAILSTPIKVVEMIFGPGNPRSTAAIQSSLLTGYLKGIAAKLKELRNHPLIMIGRLFGSLKYIPKIVYSGGGCCMNSCQPSTHYTEDT